MKKGISLQFDDDGKAAISDEDTREHLCQKFKCQFKQWSDGRQLVNAVHENVPAQIERTRFVSSDGLTDIGDGTHFDARSARELGRRYADAYADILH